MNKCLVTTLKASTNNEALSKYNVLTVKIKATDSAKASTNGLYVGASENGTVSINSSNVGIYQSGFSGPLASYPLIVPAKSVGGGRFENKDGIIEVTGKYNISKLTVGDNGTIRIREIYGIPATIDDFYIKSIEEREIDVTKLSNSLNRSKITQIIIPTANISFINKLSKNTVGEFKAISTIDELFCLLFDGIGLDDLANNINIINIMFTSLKPGNLSSLAKLTKLTRISFKDSSQNTGDIMDFINPWIQAGRTSGKIEVNWLLNQKNITLNGSPITYPEGVTNEKAYLNWTSNGNVTFTAS